MRSKNIVGKLLNRDAALLTFGLLFSSSLCAFPFPMQDARTAALGGAGVAIDVRNAPFANPALMATGVENYDWIIMLPSRGEVKTEGDSFDNNLDEVRQSESVNGVGSQQVIDLVETLDQNSYNESNFNTITIVVPNEVISAVGFYKKIEYRSAKVKTGLADADPAAVDNAYNAIVEHRAIIVQEQGISLAKLLHDPIFLPFNDVMFGMNVKLSLIKAYGHDEHIIDGSSNYDPNTAVKTSGFVSFDFGFAKEFGVWKMGLVIKDVFKSEHEYGESGDFHKVQPLIRAGFAYRSRKTLWEFDSDLTTNQSVGHQSDSKYLALGFEHELLPGWHLRFGLRKNTVGDELLTQTGGMGFNYFGMEINFAVIRNTVEKGGFSQLIMEF